MKKTRYIAVTGGVLSGLGKGVVISSLGMLLKSQGYNVTILKIDPYINIDAGTMRPTEHGEVFVTKDGGEIDQDIGTYERFLDCELTKKNNMTTGQVYLTVIEKERRGEYLGEDVEVIPHIPEEIKRRFRQLADDSQADFVLIEVGGTVGDYQSVLFLEAVREMRLENEEIMYIHVAYLPIPKHIGEMKTKPAQHSIMSLNSIGIQPDIFIGRSEKPMDDKRKEKIHFICNVKRENIFSAPNLDSIYEEPLIFEEQNMTEKVLGFFGLPYKKNKISDWEGFVSKINGVREELVVGIIGKYFDTGDFSLEDSYVSVIESVKHACWKNGVRASFRWLNSKKFEKDKSSLSDLDDCDCIIVPGGFGKSGVEGKILAIKYARENDVPYLGLCYGLQLAVVEFARNVCGMKDANSTEIDPDTKFPVIDILPEQKVNLEEDNMGGSMRLGDHLAVLKEGTVVRGLYGKDKVVERHRHRYEVNPEFIEDLEKKGLVFSGKSPDRRLMEFVELSEHSYFVGTQAHPEFKSRPMKPAPLFDGLIQAALDKKGKKE